MNFIPEISIPYSFEPLIDIIYFRSVNYKNIFA